VSNSSASKSFKERMKDAALPTRTVPINMATKLVAEHAALNQQLADAMAKEPPARPQRAAGKVGTSPEVDALTAQVEALEAAMEDSWVDFVLQGKPFNVWRDFKEANPPTEVAEDQGFRVNMRAVVNDFLRGCIVEPAIDDDDWQRMLNGGIWPGDLELLASHVVGMHEVGFSVPKSRLVLAVRATFDEQSSQLAASAFQSVASTGGSRPRHTSTSTPAGS
jgi:hypothetical protein